MSFAGMTVKLSPLGFDGRLGLCRFRLRFPAYRRLHRRGNLAAETALETAFAFSDGVVIEQAGLHLGKVADYFFRREHRHFHAWLVFKVFRRDARADAYPAFLGQLFFDIAAAAQVFIDAGGGLAPVGDSPDDG